MSATCATRLSTRRERSYWCECDVRKSPSLIFVPSQEHQWDEHDVERSNTPTPWMVECAVRWNALSIRKEELHSKRPASAMANCSYLRAASSRDDIQNDVLQESGYSTECELAFSFEAKSVV